MNPVSTLNRLAGTAALLLTAVLATAAAPGTAPLADAVQACDAARIEQLLKADAVKAAQPDGMTALHWAAHYSDAKLGARLLKLGADPSAKNRYSITPLHLACLNGNADLVAALLAAGANPNEAVNGGESPLHTASRTGNAAVVKQLIKAGANVDAKERNGQTAAMWAAAEGHLAVVNALLDAGADFNTPLERSGFTPFFFAIREGHSEIVHLLLRAGTDVNAAMDASDSKGKLPKDGTSPLLLAIENGHYDLAVELLEAGANPNDDRTGFTPLHTLTWIRKPDIGESAAGDPEPLGSGRRNSEQFIRELVRRGADVNARVKDGRAKGLVSFKEATPFFMAADRADLAYMKLLVELGANPHLPNEHGTTPFMVAAGVGSQAPEEEAGNEQECLAATRYLISLGAKVDIVDTKGETAMHGAAYKNIPAVVQYLDDIGADIKVWNQKNKRGWTPLLIAEGYRPGNFKPSFETVDAITKVMLARGVQPPTGPKPKHSNYVD